MRNLIANIYCARDRNTDACAMHDSYSLDGDVYIAVGNCLQCNCCVVEFAGAGKSLAERGLPRLRNGVDLGAFQNEL